MEEIVLKKGKPEERVPMLQTMKELLLWLEDNFGGNEAIVDYPQGRRWTYRDLGDYSRRICASYKKDGGVKEGDRIGWLSLNASADILAVSFGAKKMGAIPVVMNPRASLEYIAWMINNTGLKTLAYSSDSLDIVRKVREMGVPSVREYIALEERGGFDNELTIDEIYETYRGADEPGANTTENDDCFICHTTGTTGKPKPILHKEAEWAWTTMIYAYQFSLHFDDVFVTSASPAFAGWSHMTCGTLRAAAKQVVSRFKPLLFLNAMTEERGTHSQLSPTLIRMIYEEYKKHSSAEFNLETFRVSLVAGEAVTEDVVTMIREMFPNLQRLSGAGATEGISLFTAVPSAYLNEHWSTVGKAIPGITIELRDPETGEVVKEPHKAGEMYMKGLGVAEGVWNDPEQTEKNFPGRWWKSGDLLYRDEQGYYYFTGRSDHMFKSGGIKIFSEEVEGNLKRHPSVLDAVVVPIPHQTFGYSPFAHIRNNEPLNAEAMEKWWHEQNFGRYMCPKKWRFWGEEEFPVIGMQKIDRKKLKEEALEG